MVHFFPDRGPLLGPRPTGELAPRSRKFLQGKTCRTLFSYPKWFYPLWNLTSSCLHSFHSFLISTKHTFCNQHSLLYLLLQKHLPAMTYCTAKSVHDNFNTLKWFCVLCFTVFYFLKLSYVPLKSIHIATYTDIMNCFYCCKIFHFIYLLACWWAFILPVFLVPHIMHIFPYSSMEEFNWDIHQGLEFLACRAAYT